MEMRELDLADLYKLNMGAQSSNLDPFTHASTKSISISICECRMGYIAISDITVEGVQGLQRMNVFKNIEGKV